MPSPSRGETEQLNQNNRRAGSARASAKATTPGLAARRCAAAAFDQVLRARLPLDETLDVLIPDHGLDARDGALARAIANASFRHLGSIRAFLGERLAQGLPAKAGSLEAILVTGAAQILHLDVPDHSAVDLAVTLATEDNRTAPYGALVNAVLRGIAREAEALKARRDPLLHDTPGWLAERWIAAYGAEGARAIAAGNGREAALDLTVRADGPHWAGTLGADLLPTGSLRLADKSPVRELAGYEEGAWWVQDAAAALPAMLLASRPGERIIDLCAAPGGKTAQLAAAGACVLAVDRSAKRLERLAANMARLSLEVRTQAVDAAQLESDPADAVLLDAPCSATGTLRRHPEIAWTKTSKDIAKLAELQRQLLDKAATLVKPGGRLVYCTCSLEPEEGEGQAAAFLSRHPAFRPAPVAPAEVPGLEDAVTPDGFLRTRPSHWADRGERRSGLDGFFVARFVRA